MNWKLNRLGVLIVTLFCAPALALSLAPGVATATPHTRAAGGLPITDITNFDRDWYGHTRVLSVNSDRSGKELIDSGCCEPVLRVWLKYSDPSGDGHDGSLRARVTRVRVLEPKYVENPPKVGDVGIYRWQRGVVVSPFSGTNYCGPRASQSGICGA